MKNDYERTRQMPLWWDCLMILAALLAITSFVFGTTPLWYTLSGTSPGLAQTAAQTAAQATIFEGYPRRAPTDSREVKRLWTALEEVEKRVAALERQQTQRPLNPPGFPPTSPLSPPISSP